jgi:hypothetical protein
MPPLTTERYVQPPKPTERELALRREAKQGKSDAYGRMSRILSRPEKGFGILSGSVESVKAVYQVEGQPRGELTRAWLSRDKIDDMVVLQTDRVRVNGNNAVVVEDSQFTHLALGEEGELHTKEYSRLGAEQLLDLMDGVNDTLELIEKAVTAEAAANA